jgi:hypothetical protein
MTTFGVNPFKRDIIAPKASEPINSRAEDYRSPGDNSSPAGETIAAIIGTCSFDGKIVWWGEFKLKGEKVSASFAMVFADCIFTDSAALLKLFADEILIISNVAPTRQSGQKIRFYDGSQTAVDPLLTERLGAANASAWPGFVYAVFEDFDCSPYGNRIPLIRAVISGAVTEAAGQEEESTLAFVDDITSYNNSFFTVDPTRNVHYQIYRRGLSEAFISTIDITTNREINRAQIFGIVDFWEVGFPVALYGSDYIACSVGVKTIINDIRPALLNTRTGELVTELPQVSGWQISPKRAAILSSTTSTKYLVIGENRDDSDVPVGGSDFSAFVVDVTAETMEYVIHPFSAPVTGANGTDPISVEFGEIFGGSATVWWTEPHPSLEGAVYVALISGTDFTAGYFYEETESGKAPKGVAYDALNNILVVYRADGSFLKLHGTTGALISTTAGAVTDYNINIWFDDPAGGVHENKAFMHSHSGGTVLATRGDLNGDIYEINLQTLTATLRVDRSDFSNSDTHSVYFDMFSGVMTEGNFENDKTGIINKVTIGGSTPDTVDLQDIFTQLATFDDRFEAGDLTFTNFPGNECSGLKLENDTTVDNLEQSIADLFDVKIVESDGNRKYFYPKRDGSFAIDATLVAADFVERGATTIEKSFGAGEDEFQGCTVQYFDVDADYKKIDQTYRRPIGVYDVTRSKKVRTLNSVLSMTSGQAMRAATLAVYRSVLGNETYSFGLVPGKSHLEPADILQFDFRGFTIYGRVKEATLKADYSQEVQLYQYLQYADATFTGSGLDDPDAPTVSFGTRFIYLDVPLLAYAHDLDGDGLVQYAQIGGFGPGIINASAYKSTDGLTFVSLGLRAGISPITGTVSAVTGYPADPSVTDGTNTITINILSGDIDEVVAGQRAAIGMPGRWCIVTFDGVADTDGQLTVSDLDWGYANGSEVWRDQVAEGDIFVLIDPDHYVRFTNPTASLDEDTYYYKAATVGVHLGSVLSNPYVVTGVAETPYAPVNLDAVVDGSDIDLTWDYRSRVASGLNPTNYGEATLSFEIEIIGTGSPAVLRTLTATTNSKTYLSADITTDFGGIPAFLTFRVYMMSALDILVPGQTPVVAGRGYVGENTVQLSAEGMPIGLLLTLTYV